MKKQFIAAAVTALMLVTLAVGHAEILPPHGVGQIGLQAVVLCDSLTVREEPSTSSKTVEKLRYQDLPIVVEEEKGWARCVLGDAEDSPSGWVNSDYIAVDPSWYKTEKKTPVYAWKDTKAPKVALLNAGTTHPILKEEGDWLVISLRGASGWVYIAGER